LVPILRRATSLTAKAEAQQADAGTIESQLATLRSRIAADGEIILTEMEFIDDGYSGTSLVLPGMDRLRDLAYAGGIDRLARKYAYQEGCSMNFGEPGLKSSFSTIARVISPKTNSCSRSKA
jgi:hypothetical protein